MRAARPALMAFSWSRRTTTSRSRTDLRAHFAEVSEAAGETPIALYNIPSRSVINMSPEFIGSLATEFREHHRGQAGEQRRHGADRGPRRPGGERRRLRSLPSRRGDWRHPRRLARRRAADAGDLRRRLRGRPRPRPRDRARALRHLRCDRRRSAGKLDQGDPRDARPDRRNAALADGSRHRARRARRSRRSRRTVS